MNDTTDNLIADTTVGASVEQIVKYTIHKFSLAVGAINIHPIWLWMRRLKLFVRRFGLILRLIIRLWILGRLLT